MSRFIIVDTAFEDAPLRQYWSTLFFDTDDSYTDAHGKTVYFKSYDEAYTLACVFNTRCGNTFEVREVK